MEKLRIIVDTLWYVTNENFHKDLNILTMKEELRRAVLSNKSQLENNPNTLASNIASSNNRNRGLNIKFFNLLLTQ